MGLPLYIAPVESDTKGLPPPTVPASSRSSIRRLRHRGSDVARESRRRALYAAAVYHPAEGAEPWSRRSRSTSHEPRAAPSTSNPGSDTNGPGLSPAYIRGYQRAVEFQRRQVARPDGPDGDMPANTEVLIRVLTGPPDGPPRLSPLQAAPAPPTSGDLARSANDAYTESAPSGRLGLSAYETWDPEGVVPRRAPAPQPESEPSARRLPPSPPPPRPRQYARRGGTGGISRSRGVTRGWTFGLRNSDGLGDRQRSTSPENDWDTLLSTIPPDPQPPSIGSSFASESASAVASQSAGAVSSSTSLTGPEMVEDLGTIVINPDLACESGCENSDTEGDDDEDEDVFARNFPELGATWANVAAANMAAGRGPAPRNLGDRIEYWGGLRRIVHSLARREDIPDEWWAEVGLSRNLP